MARKKPRKGPPARKPPEAKDPAAHVAAVEPPREQGLKAGFNNADYLKMIGRRLRARRLVRTMTPSDLAKAVSQRGQKLSDDTVSNYENGVSNMKLVTLREISVVLGIELIELLDDRSAFDYGQGRSRAPGRDRLAELSRRLSPTHLGLLVQYGETLLKPAVPPPRKVA